MTQADSEQELMENMVEAIELNVEWLRSEGLPIPSAAVDQLRGGAISIPDGIPEHLRERFMELDVQMFHSDSQRRVLIA